VVVLRGFTILGFREIEGWGDFGCVDFGGAA